MSSNHEYNESKKTNETMDNKKFEYIKHFNVFKYLHEALKKYTYNLLKYLNIIMKLKKQM